MMVAGAAGWACAPEERSVADVVAERTEALRAWGTTQTTLLANRERAEALLARSRETARARVQLAEALLRAGRTDEAIAVLDAAEATPAVTRMSGIAHLRRGEEANCLTRGHAADVCIFPLRGDGVHADPEPARRAAALFSQLLDAEPDDLATRWLLNVAHQAAGTYPGGVPARHLLPALGPPTDREVALENVAAERGLAAMTLSGSAALDDFDGDGDLDLVTTTWALGDHARFYENDGRGHFTDRTAEAGLSGVPGGLNLVHADVDNDGDADVLVLRGAWLGKRGRIPNSLLRNDGGRFTDVTYAAGLRSEAPTQTAAFADVDGDGWLDLFVGNEGRNDRRGRFASELFLNRGDGTFRDASAEAGLDVVAFVKGAVWGNVDGDGRPDLYLSVMGAPNQLFLNRSTPGAPRFVPAQNAAGAARPARGFPAAFLDWDHDGDDDLVAFALGLRGYTDDASTLGDVAAEALGLPLAGEPSRLYRNDGGRFTDVTEAVGLDRVAMAVMGANVEDLDGDGAFDLYAGTGAPALAFLVPNRLLMGTTGGAFTDRTVASGTGHLQKGHGVAFGDLDGDLDPDLFAVMGGAYDADTASDVLFDNPWQDTGWVVLRLDGRRANRSAIGARVALHLRAPGGGARTLWRTVNTGASFGANSLQLEVGLGGDAVERVEVWWPGSGTHSVYRDVAAGGRYRLVEGETTARPFSLKVDAQRAAPSGHEHGIH